MHHEAFGARHARRATASTRTIPDALRRPLEGVADYHHTLWCVRACVRVYGARGCGCSVYRCAAHSETGMITPALALGATSTTPRASPASGLPGRPPLWQADFISLATPLRTKRRHRRLISGMPAIRQCRCYSAGFRANYLPHACYAS